MSKNLFPLFVVILSQLLLSSCATQKVTPTASIIISPLRNSSQSLPPTSIIAITPPSPQQKINPIAVAIIPKNSPPKPLNKTSSAPTQDLWTQLISGYQLNDEFDNIQSPYHTHHYLRQKKALITLQNRAKPFLNHILYQVKQRKLPTELALLPAIESSYKTNASSHRKAAGLWQFMPRTGRAFGLEQTWWYDGRKDVYLSTHKALDYLQILYRKYDDWLLALAAYNCGSTKLSKILNGRKLTYWQIRHRLPRETRNYIPKLLTLAHLLKNNVRYGIELIPLSTQAEFSFIHTNHPVNMQFLAKLSQLTLPQLRDLNAGYKRINTGPGTHHLLVPEIHKQRILKQLSFLAKDNSWQQHKIKSGETLSSIASRYQTTVLMIKKINKMTHNLIIAGSIILVPAHEIIAMN